MKPTTTIKIFDKKGEVELKIGKGKKFTISKEGIPNIERIEIYG